MVRRLRISLPVLLAATALIAGCGSSGSSSGSSAATSSTPATSSTATTRTSSTATSTSSKVPGGAEAVAACKRGIKSLAHLQQKITGRLEAICEKAASGDANAQRKAAEEACREIVKASPLPAGEAKDRALAGCKNAGGAK
ncbi:MAG: hypothetical protein ACHQHO_05500 [Solirubrobacterales bacterium]